MAAAHVCATMPNFDILEFSYGEAPWRAALVDPPESPDKGLYRPLPASWPVNHFEQKNSLEVKA